MNTLVKLFLFFAFFAVASLAFRNLDAFILFGIPANVLGIWGVVKSWKTGKI
jgi:hypothetical protein